MTVNPAIDRNVTTDRLVFEDRAYILSTSESAGGRGINASCVIASFGGETRAVVTSGGTSAERFQKLLGCCGYPIDVVAIRNDIRTNLTITDKHGLTVKLNEVGPKLDKAEVEQVEKTVRDKIAGSQWLMLCGSLPPGVPADFYARLIEIAHKKKVKVLLDADGDALREGIQAKPTIVAPNQQEAERLLDTALLTRSHFLDGVRRIAAMGAQSVTLSLGSRGAIGLNGKSLWEAIPPRIDAVCPIGSGDALAAAFIWSMANRGDFADALRWGVAAGTASAKLPGVRFASLAQTKEVYEKVELRKAE